MNTPREQQVVDLLLQGCENKEIARQLHMALRTVKGHMRRLFERYEIPPGGMKRVRLAVFLYRMQLQDAADSKIEPWNIPCQEGS